MSEWLISNNLRVIASPIRANDCQMPVSQLAFNLFLFLFYFKLLNCACCGITSLWRKSFREKANKLRKNVVCLFKNSLRKSWKNHRLFVSLFTVFSMGSHILTIHIFLYHAKQSIVYKHCYATSAFSLHTLVLFHTCTHISAAVHSTQYTHDW